MELVSLRVSDFSNPLRISSSISVSRNSMTRQRSPSRRRWRCRRMRSAAAVRVADSTHDNGCDVISIHLCDLVIYIPKSLVREVAREAFALASRIGRFPDRYLRLSARNCSLLERHAPHQEKPSARGGSVQIWLSDPVSSTSERRQRRHPAVAQKYIRRHVAGHQPSRSRGAVHRTARARYQKG